MSAPFADFGTCATCGQTVAGSHYHCSCGSTDVTSMYGHHTSFCKVTKTQRELHHCGPAGCSLEWADA